MLMINTKALSKLLQDLKSSDEKAAKRSYARILQITHLETRIYAITYAARNCCWDKLAKKAFSDLCEEMSKSGEYTAEQEAGQMEDMVYLGCKIPSIRISAIEYILGLIEDGKIRKDIDGTKKFLYFIVEKTKNKESSSVLRAKRILQL